MTREEAIKVLEIVESHGLTNEAKKMAIESLKQEAIPIEWMINWGSKSNNYNFAPKMFTISKMIEDWRKERKQNEISKVQK